jgi:tRNA modification GTPase
MDGSLSRRIRNIRRQIVQLLSQIEAGIEFPEEGLGVTAQAIQDTLNKTLSSVRALIDSYDRGRALSEGIRIAIAGRANVGKSTLFNALLEDQRAIVTPVPGTTRDYLREKIKIKDATFTLTDTAGMEISQHPVEKEGIERGEKIISLSRGILLVFDASKNETPEDLILLKKNLNRKCLLLFNKIDLPQKMKMETIRKTAPHFPWLEISALKGHHIPELKKLIYTHFQPETDKEEEIILHLRQMLLLDNIFSHLKSALQMMKAGHPDEVCVEEIRYILPLMGQLTGEIKTEEVLQNIFSHFCVGK